MEVLRLVAVGHSNKRIASELMLSGNTLKIQASALLAALEDGNRTECIHAARRLGLIG